MKIEIILEENVITRLVIDTDDYIVVEKKESEVFKIARFISEIQSDPREFIETADEPNTEITRGRTLLEVREYKG